MRNDFFVYAWCLPGVTLEVGQLLLAHRILLCLVSALLFINPNQNWAGFLHLYVSVVRDGSCFWLHIKLHLVLFSFRGVSFNGKGSSIFPRTEMEKRIFLSRQLKLWCSKYAASLLLSSEWCNDIASNYSHKKPKSFLFLLPWARREMDAEAQGHLGGMLGISIVCALATLSMCQHQT